MVYAYDQNMQMPVKDLYDTQMMAIAINAAKDMYEKGLELMDLFNKLYGDFYTPISKDMAAYNSLVIDPYKDAIDRLYANGIDPIRSAEGRAVLARIKNSVPTGKVNALKLSAETAKLYQKALAEAIASGKYDPDVDRFFNPVGLDEWDTLGSSKIPGMGVWNRPAPTTIKTIKDATSDWFDKRTPHDLTPEQMKAAGYKADPNYDYTGFLYDDLLKTAGNMTPGWQTSMEARYYRDQAKKQLEAAGVKDITPAMIEAQLQRNVAEANREYIVEPVRTENKYRYKEYESRLAYNNWKKEYDYALAHPKSTDSSSRSKSEGGNSSKMPDSVYDRNRAAMIGQISGVSGALMADPNAVVLASAQIKPYLTRFGQQFEQQYGQQLRSGVANNIYTPWNGMLNPVNRDAYAFYKLKVAVPLGAEQFYQQFGITPREDYAGLTSYRGLPMSDVADKLISPEDFITNTTGMIDGAETHNTNSMRQQLPKDGYIIPQDFAMSPMQKDGRLHEGWWVDVYDARGNKIGEAVYDTNITSDYIRKSDGTIISNAGLTSTPTQYIANIGISSESAPAATYRGRNLDSAQKLTNVFDNSETYFVGSPTLEFIKEPE